MPNIGRLQNEGFFNRYKELGFPTRTQMIDAAGDALREKLAKEHRQRWITEAHQAYKSEGSDYMWSAIDDEDFFRN